MGLDMTEFVMDVEERFGIEIPDKDYPALDTVGTLCDYIAQKTSSRDADAVWTTVQEMVSEHFQIPLHTIKRESRWGEDLQIY